MVVVRPVSALLALIEGDDVDHDLVEEEKRVATQRRVQIEPVKEAVDDAMSLDTYVQNGRRQADLPNPETGKWMM